MDLWLLGGHRSRSELGGVVPGMLRLCSMMLWRRFCSYCLRQISVHPCFSLYFRKAICTEEQKLVVDILVHEWKAFRYRYVLNKAEFNSRRFEQLE